MIAISKNHDETNKIRMAILVSSYSGLLPLAVELSLYRPLIRFDIIYEVKKHCLSISL